MTIPLPAESDYPAETFGGDLPTELRVGCAFAYFRSSPTARRLFRRRVDLAFELVSGRRWERVLDAGTGAGFMLPGLASLADQVIGVDLSGVLGFTQGMLERRRVANVWLEYGDLLQLPFAAESFDLVTCLSVIEHIPDPTAAFAEFARGLRPAGTLVVGYPLEHGLFRFFEALCRGYKRLKLRARARRGPAFHPHVSRHATINGSWEPHFRLDADRLIRLAGIPMYRIARLIRSD